MLVGFGDEDGDRATAPSGARTTKKQPATRNQGKVDDARDRNVQGKTPQEEQSAQPSTSSAAGRTLQAAQSKIGAPYEYGASGPDSFDCSGLTQWSYGQAGVAVPRTSQGQAQAGTPVSPDQLQPGDLVFFYDDNSHVGIYDGNGNVVHAPTGGESVKVTPIRYMPYDGAVRYY